MRIYHVILIGVILARMTFGHEVWVTATIPNGQATVEVLVNCGHHFPSSSLAVADRVLRTVILTGPDRTATELSTTRHGTQWFGRADLSRPGLYSVTAILQQPRQSEPQGWSRVWIDRDSPSPPVMPGIGEGLELRVISPWDRLRAGREIHVVALRDGQPVPASGTLFYPDGTTRRLHVPADEPAALFLRQAGLVLLSVREGGQFSTLTLVIAEE